MSYELPRGYAPLYRSLTQPILLGGIPEKMTVPLWVGIIGFALILWQGWIVPIGVTIHVVLVLFTRWDPHFFSYCRKALHNRHRLEP